MSRFLRNITRSLLCGLAGAAFVAELPGQEVNQPSAASTAADAAVGQVTDQGKQRSASDNEFRRRSAAQWRKLLTPKEFYVTRQHGTEQAYSHPSHNSKADGIYRCVCCEQELFDSRHKFDSGTGWPSFYQGVSSEKIETSRDFKLGYQRTEVHCSRCDAHLGHVFADAPQTPTGLRYCINGVAIKRTDRDESDAANSQTPAAPPQVIVSGSAD